MGQNRRYRGLWLPGTYLDMCELLGVVGDGEKNSDGDHKWMKYFLKNFMKRSFDSPKAIWLLELPWSKEKDQIKTYWPARPSNRCYFLPLPFPTSSFKHSRTAQ